jgi:hypothetical protein
MRRLFALGLALLSVAASAEPFAARETAAVGKKGDYSVGVIAPLTLAVADGFELRAHPLLFFVSPNLDVRKSHWESGLWQVAGEYGISVPTPVLKLTQSFLFPVEGTVGWFLVPHVGGVASRGDLNSDVLSISADLAVGIPLTRSNWGPPGQAVVPLGAPPFLETELAPITTGYRFRLGGIYDYRLSESWRLRGYADVFVHGANPSPVTVRAGAAVELRVGKMSRVTAGAVWWNADQQAIDTKTWQHVRSNDFLPTLDFIWAG